MGVYIFRCLDAPWVKVGHHKISTNRPNVYFRIAGRGFNSCVHPGELTGRLSIHDMCLVAWYPSLSRRDETRIHRSCTHSCGEFHPVSELATILSLCNTLGKCVMPAKEDRDIALAWAGRRARRPPLTHDADELVDSGAAGAVDSQEAAIPHRQSRRRRRVP